MHLAKLAFYPQGIYGLIMINQKFHSFGCTRDKSCTRGEHWAVTSPSKSVKSELFFLSAHLPSVKCSRVDLHVRLDVDPVHGEHLAAAVECITFPLGLKNKTEHEAVIKVLPVWLSGGFYFTHKPPFWGKLKLKLEVQLLWSFSGRV